MWHHPQTTKGQELPLGVDGITLDSELQSAVAAFGSIALFGFNIPVLAQVRNRPFYGGQRHGEIFRNPLFGRPALTVRICSVAEIHIKRNCSARKIVAVSGRAKPDCVTFLKICEVLETSADQLLGIKSSAECPSLTEWGLIKKIPNRWWFRKEGSKLGFGCGIWTRACQPAQKAEAA